MALKLQKRPLLPQDRFLDGLNQAENLKESYDNATSIISAFLKKSAAVFRIKFLGLILLILRILKELL